MAWTESQVTYLLVPSLGAPKARVKLCGLFTHTLTCFGFTFRLPLILPDVSDLGKFE